MTPSPNAFPRLTGASLKRLSEKINTLSLNTDAEDLLAEDLNYRLLHMLSIALRFTKGSDRNYLSVDDIDLAFRRFFSNVVETSACLTSQQKDDRGAAESETVSKCREFGIAFYLDGHSRFEAGRSALKIHVKINPHELFSPSDFSYNNYAECIRRIVNEEDLSAIPSILNDIRKSSNVSVPITKFLRQLDTVVSSKKFTQHQRWNILIVFHAIIDNSNVIFDTTSHLAYRILQKLLVRNKGLSAEDQFFYLVQVSCVLKRAVDNSERHFAGFGDIWGRAMLNQLHQSPASYIVPYLTALRVCNADDKVVESVRSVSRTINTGFKSGIITFERADGFFRSRELLRQSIVKALQRSRRPGGPQIYGMVKYRTLEEIFGEQITALVNPTVLQNFECNAWPVSTPPPNTKVRSAKSGPPTAIVQERKKRLAADQEQLRKRLRLFHLFDPHTKAIDIGYEFGTVPRQSKITFAFGKNLTEVAPARQSKQYRLGYLWNKPQHTFRVIVKHMPMRRMREQSYENVFSTCTIFSTF